MTYHPTDNDDDGTVEADVDNTSVSTEQLNSDYIYASAFDGSNKERRLDNALGAASLGDIIYLESGVYSENRTISKRVTIKSGRGGAALSETWTLAVRVFISGLLLTGGASPGQFQLNADRCIARGIEIRDKITVNGSDCVLSNIIAPFGDTVEFTSNSSGCIIDSSAGVSVTDNGSNTVGDIA